MNTTPVDIRSLASEYDASMLEHGPPLVLVMAYVDALRSALTASERRLLHVIGVMRMGGYWAAVMSDTEILAQIDEDMP